MTALPVPDKLLKEAIDFFRASCHEGDDHSNLQFLQHLWTSHHDDTPEDKTFKYVERLLKHAEYTRDNQSLIICNKALTPEQIEHFKNQQPGVFSTIINKKSLPYVQETMDFLRLNLKHEKIKKAVMLLTDDALYNVLHYFLVEKP
jgi:hypothetical protein